MQMKSGIALLTLKTMMVMAKQTVVAGLIAKSG
jgi:hypothetical protein